MAKWKCGICKCEFNNFHAEGFDDVIYCPDCIKKDPRWIPPHKRENGNVLIEKIRKDAK